MLSVWTFPWLLISIVEGKALGRGELEGRHRGGGGELEGRHREGGGELEGRHQGGSWREGVGGGC